MEETHSFIDHYEMLQLSPNSDFDTIERVYRLLAKKYHPDNKTTGSADKFKMLVDSYRTLSDPEKRASYDASYEDGFKKRWQMLYKDIKNEPQDDRAIRNGILMLLYNARRQDTQQPGLGIYELEMNLNAPEKYLEFHLWYLKEKGWIQKTDNGQFAITVDGVDEITRNGSNSNEGYLLQMGNFIVKE